MQDHHKCPLCRVKWSCPCAGQEPPYSLLCPACSAARNLGQPHLHAAAMLAGIASPSPT